MSSTVTTYVQPIMQPLEGLYTSFTQMASQHRDMNDRLRAHRNDLLSNTPFTFEGSGALAFSNLLSSYLDTSEKHLQIFDDAAGTVRTCHSTVTTASSSADAAGLHQGLTHHVLSQVTPNDIIQRGSDPIQAVISDMQRTLHDLASSTGGIFSNLIHFHFGSAFADLMQAGGDIKQLGSDVMNLLQDIGRVLGQWATTVFDAIQKCLPAIEAAAKNVLNFVTTHWTMIKNDISLIGKLKISKSLSAFIKRMKLPLTALSVVFNVLDGKDNTQEKFFSDVNGQLITFFIAPLSEAKLVFGLFSEGGQLLGGAQQNLIAPWLAKNDPTLAQELGAPGAALGKDAQGIDIGGVFTDLGDAIYNINPIEKIGGQLFQDALHNPQNFIPDIKNIPNTIQHDVNPSAALGDLKKAGGGLGDALVSDFEMGGDIAATGIDDYYALKGNKAAIASNNQFLEQQWRPQIDSFKKWLAATI